MLKERKNLDTKDELVFPVANRWFENNLKTFCIINEEDSMPLKRLHITESPCGRKYSFNSKANKTRRSVQRRRENVQLQGNTISTTISRFSDFISYLNVLLCFQLLLVCIMVLVHCALSMPTVVEEQLIPVAVYSDAQGTDDLVAAEHHSHGENLN